MSSATTRYSLKETSIPDPQTSSDPVVASQEEVESDRTGDREFCIISVEEGAMDFMSTNSSGSSIHIAIPKEVAIKRDWRGVTKGSLPTFSHTITLPTSNIVLSLPHNIDFNMLMSTEKGAAIPGEVLLNIIEKSIDLEPTAVRTLSLVSKGFKLLIDTFEKSIVGALVLNDDGKLAFTNSQQTPIIGIANISAYSILDGRDTYKWYSEMRSRAVIVEFLAHHPIMYMDKDPGHNWPTLDPGKGKLYEREIMLKKNGLHLLFKLADCIAGLAGTDEIRGRQNQFLEALSEIELAILIATVELLGVGFGNWESKKKNTEDIDPYDITERACVFADKVQRFGPYFASAYLSGTLNEDRRPDLWAWEEIEQGLENLRSFEVGYTMAYASLQSVGWKIFTQKMGCVVANRWNEAKKLIEVEMAEYKL